MKVFYCQAQEFSVLQRDAQGARGFLGDVTYRILLTLLSHSFFKKLVFKKTLPLHACLK